MPHRGAAPEAANRIKGHPTKVGGSSPTSVNPVFYKLGLQPLTLLPFLSLIIKKLVNQLNTTHYYELSGCNPFNIFTS